MPSQLRVIVVFWALLAGACTGESGGPCKGAGDCPGGLCLSAAGGFPDGYCSSSCELSTCGPAEECRSAGGGPVCLLRCSGPAACRVGYQCFDGVCAPPCKADEDCGSGGFLCQRGACVARPGAPNGAGCDTDEDCSSATCVGGGCAQLCDRDGACPGGQTCTLDRAAPALRAYCVDRRAAAAPLASCSTDTDCDRGSCLMGACLLLCQTPQDCGADPTALSCTGVPAPLRALSIDSWPEMRVCLPRNQNFTVSARPGNLLIPQTARSVLLFTSVKGYDEDITIGLLSLQDSAGTKLYQVPSDDAAYFRNEIRGRPDIGCSSLLLSSSPMRAPVQLGVYPFQAFAQRSTGASVPYDVQVIYKLYDAPALAGRVPLRVHVTDMSGLPSTCTFRTLNAGNAPTQLQKMIQRIRDIYQQQNVGLTLDPITFVDSTASSSVQVTNEASLRGVLRAASQATSGGLDLILVRSISPNVVLGIAGGVPASPGISGSPHTGAVASIAALCIPQLRITPESFGNTVAHELGHTLGLSHNREQGGQSDPLGDGTARSESYLQDTSNLMYWSADFFGSQLTEEQGMVMRSMPQVRP